MPLLIDGFNLIYKFPQLEELMYAGSLIKAREGLLDILKEYQGIKKNRIRVVFDGKKEPARETRSETIGTIDIFYSLDYSADHLIKQFIKKDINPRMTTVITSDKEIQFYVNRFKVKIMTSEQFSALVIRTIEEFHTPPEIPQKEENPLVTEEEISFWEKIFRKK